MLRVAFDQAIATLDPVDANSEPSLAVLAHTCDTLVAYRPARELLDRTLGGGDDLVPQLATSWTVSPDGLDYAFELRDASFPDGQPLTSAVVKRSLERVIHSKTSPFGSFLAALRDGEAIEAPDPRHVVVHLAHADPTFLYVLAMKMAAPVSTPAPGGSPQDPGCLGPFVIERWDPGIELVLARTPGYWDTRARGVDRIEIQEQVPLESAMLLFERGDIDLLDRPTAPDYLWLRSRPDWAPYLLARPALNTAGLVLDTAAGPFADRRVRQAVNQAIDRGHLARLLQGRVLIAGSPTPPILAGHDARVAPAAHDLEGARALLAQAGYPDGFEVDFVTFQSDEQRAVSASIQADLAAIGIRAQIRALGFAAYYAELTQPSPTRVAFVAWSFDLPDPRGMLEPQFHSRAIVPGQVSNLARFADATVDTLLDDAGAAGAMDRAARYARVDRALAREVPWVWLYHYVYVEVRQPYVQDYAPHPIWGRDFREVWIARPPGGE